jgi:hypothetical protein
VKDAIPVVVSNLTPTFYGIMALIVIVVGALIKAWPSLDRQKREGDASLRADLMQMLTEERTTHAAAMAALRQEMQDERRRCDEEVRGLRDQVKGLERMIIQFSSSAGRAIELTNVPEAAKSIPRVEEHLAKRGEE